jgi:hypothetical protein
LQHVFPTLYARNCRLVYWLYLAKERAKVAPLSGENELLRVLRIIEIKARMEAIDDSAGRALPKLDASIAR